MNDYNAKHLKKKYKDAIDLLYKTKWKTKTCPQGSKCWCRMIEPVKPIFWEERRDSLYIASSGALDKRAAQYIVKLHNQNIKEK